MTPDGASRRLTCLVLHARLRRGQRELPRERRSGDRLPARAVLGVVTHRRSVSLFSLPLEYADLSPSRARSLTPAVSLAPSVSLLLVRQSLSLRLPALVPWHTRKAVAAATAASTHRVARKFDTRTPRDQRGIRRSVALTTTMTTTATTTTCRIAERESLPRCARYTSRRLYLLSPSITYTLSLSLSISSLLAAAAAARAPTPHQRSNSSLRHAPRPFGAQLL